MDDIKTSIILTGEYKPLGPWTDDYVPLYGALLDSSVPVCRALHTIAYALLS